MSDSVQVLSKIDPVTDSPYLGDCTLVVGDHAVVFKNGRATTNPQAAGLLANHRHVDVFGDTSPASAPVVEERSGAKPEEPVVPPPAPSPEPETTPEPVPAAVTPVEPWGGYDELNAKNAVAALTGKTPDDLAKVKAYEESDVGKKRGTVIKACVALGATTPLVPRDPDDTSPLVEGDLPPGATIGPDGGIILADDADLTDAQKAQIEAARAYLADESGAGND